MGAIKLEDLSEFVLGLPSPFDAVLGCFVTPFTVTKIFLWP